MAVYHDDNNLTAAADRPVAGYSRSGRRGGTEKFFRSNDRSAPLWTVRNWRSIKMYFWTVCRLSLHQKRDGLHRCHLGILYLFYFIFHSIPFSINPHTIHPDRWNKSRCCRCRTSEFRTFTRRPLIRSRQSVCRRVYLRNGSYDYIIQR